MKSFLLIAVLVGCASAQLLSRTVRAADDGKSCEANVQSCCADRDQCGFECSSLILDKPSRYDDFVRFTNDQLIRSYEYLFLSAQFGTHLKDRPGFEKVLHGLADDAWNKGFEMIKESAERGVSHNFKLANDVDIKIGGDTSELEALAKAAEIEKTLLIRANNVHRHHSHAVTDDDKAKDYDAGLAHYLEEEIIEDKTETVRKLVGYVNDLKVLFKSDNVFPLSLYLFDQYLQK